MRVDGYFVFGVGDSDSDSGFSMHEFHFLGVVFAGLVVLMLAIGALAPRSVAWVQEHSGRVGLTPWRFAKAMGFGLLLIVLAIYVAFADVSVL